MSIALKQDFNKDKTFRPKRKFEPGTQRFELHKRAQASLNPGMDLKAAVQLPSGEDQNDWVAVHVVDFFNRINLIYGTICEFCTERTCPVMSGGPEYWWQDDLKYKKPTALPAPQYMNLLMDWIEVQINNEDIFPTSVGRKDALTTFLIWTLTTWHEEGGYQRKQYHILCIMKNGFDFSSICWFLFLQDK
ncbi:MOB kinase activator 3B-like [Corvus hawaiiensis]|uniref:MOB kinase activator 3B-like n=1 Tax=Corvus hawaiiensis TaxID=134902 RepID=UPI002019E886|nr:MOB kinase activator 3B-like [Corvus hawaiiensis]XP_048148834.1 MOB kinase activator 3B-like [Corvus hawaiiensis]